MFIIVLNLNFVAPNVGLNALLSFTCFVIFNKLFLQNLKKSSKSSRNRLSSNYYNGLLNNDKSVTNYQIKEAGGYSSQINDSQSNNQTICNNQLENSNVVFNCLTNVHSAKNSKTETINSCHQNTTICDQNNTMLPKQIILLKQQLTQHVQLLTQSYLLCSMKQTLKSHCLKLKMMMVHD